MSTTIGLNNAFVVDFSPLATKVSDEEFAELCRLNPELQLERTSERDLVIMAPTDGKTGRRNAKLNARVTTWAEQDGRGQVFDSSTLFTLPNTAKRSPDVAWVLNERVSGEPLLKDFVLELKSIWD